MQGKCLQKQKTNTSRTLTLPKVVQRKIENTFGYDLSNVRMKETDYASEIGMKAYAQGNNINFAPGQFNPLTPRGQQLVGHEISHVIQQSKGQVRHETTIGGETANLNHQLEHQADYGAKRIKCSQSTYPFEKRPILQVTGKGVIQGCGDDSKMDCELDEETKDELAKQIQAAKKFKVQKLIANKAKRKEYEKGTRESLPKRGHKGQAKTILKVRMDDKTFKKLQMLNRARLKKTGAVDVRALKVSEKKTIARKKYPPAKESHIGEWTGERGNSMFKIYPEDELKKKFSTNPKALERYLARNQEIMSRVQAVKIEGITYKDNIPDFSPVSIATIKIKMVKDRPTNFAAADKLLAEMLQFKDDEETTAVEQAKILRETFNYTWHECNDQETMQLVPSAIHDACKHQGGIAEM